MSSREDSIAFGYFKKILGTCAANYRFPNLDNPLPGDEMLKPKIHILVKVMKDGVEFPTDTFECTKLIENVLGCKFIGRYDQNGSLRMMLDEQRLADKLMKTTQIKLNNATYTIEAISDKRVNQGRGIFFTKDLNKWTKEELMEELKNNNVVDIYPLTKILTVDGEKVQVRTGAYKVTFGSATVPRELLVGCVKVSVNLYYDNPMYCRKCGQFGHTQKFCPAEKQRCLKCGKEDHETENCNNEHICVNCFKAHELNPRSCDIFKFEQECIRYATKAQISVAQARRYATKQILEFATNTAKEQTSAQLMREEKGETGEVTKEIQYPAWYDADKYKRGGRTEMTQSQGSRPIRREKRRTLGTTFWETQAPTQTQERKRAAQVSPHERVKQKDRQKSEDNEMDFDLSSESEDNSDNEPIVKKGKHDNES